MSRCCQRGHQSCTSNVLLETTKKSFHSAHAMLSTKFILCFQTPRMHHSRQPDHTTHGLMFSSSAAKSCLQTRPKWVVRSRFNEPTVRSPSVHACMRESFDPHAELICGSLCLSDSTEGAVHLPHQNHHPCRYLRKMRLQAPRPIQVDATLWSIPSRCLL